MHLDAKRPKTFAAAEDHIFPRQLSFARWRWLMPLKYKLPLIKAAREHTNRALCAEVIS